MNDLDFTDLQLSVATEDVGGTQVVHIRLGSALIGSYHAHTRHEEVALEAAHDALASAFRPIVDVALDTFAHMDRIAP